MLGKKNKGDDSHNAEAKDWYRDKHQYVLVQRNILAVITLASLLVALVTVFAIMQLTPQKTVEPFVVKIDETTGRVTQVRASTKSTYTADETVNNYFVVKYITARESYDITSIRDDARLVGVMSDVNNYRSYVQSISQNNPDSTAAKLKNKGQRTVTFKSITYLNNAQALGESYSPRSKTVQVRLTLRDTITQARISNEEHRVITMQFEYADLDLGTEDRYANPLGFLVTSYRSDRDAAL